MERRLALPDSSSQGSTGSSDRRFHGIGHPAAIDGARAPVVQQQPSARSSAAHMSLRAIELHKILPHRIQAELLAVNRCFSTKVGVPLPMVRQALHRAGFKICRSTFTSTLRLRTL